MTKLFGFCFAYFIIIGYVRKETDLFLLSLTCLIILLNYKRMQITKDIQKREDIKKDWLNQNVIKQ